MSAVAVQLPLLKPPEFTPVPPGAFHYVPALIDWKGERDALSSASAQSWTGMTPLIQIAPQGDPHAPISASNIRDRVKRVAGAVRSHPVFLSAVGMDPSRPVIDGGGRSPLQHVHEAGRRFGLSFVPVFVMGDDPDLDVVAATAAQDRRGCAIRYRFSNTHYVGGGTLGDRLSSAAERLGVADFDTDVILDFGWLGSDDDLGVDELSAALDLVIAAGKWRNVILIATSMPRSFGHIPEGTIGSVPRREWQLWQALREARADRVIFGDYGVQHPRVPSNSTGGRMRANIRYPTREGTLVARGSGLIMSIPPAERAQQYRKLCYDLVTNSLFVGRGCCMGDDTIQDCAEGRMTARGQPMWRGVGTAHNLKEVTTAMSALRSRRATSVSVRSASRRVQDGVGAGSRRGE